jgi:hypothetical protein
MQHPLAALKPPQQCDVRCLLRLAYFGVGVGYKVRLARIAQIIQESYQEDDNHLVSPQPVKPFG